MGIPILSVRDDQGNLIPIPAIQGRDGKDGKDGKDGAAGPNIIKSTTLTQLEGILMGSVGSVKTAVPGVDYMMPGTVTTYAVSINLLDGNVTASAVVLQVRGHNWLIFGGAKLDISQATDGVVSEGTKVIYPPSGYTFYPGQIIPAYRINTSGGVASTPLLESTTAYFSVTTYTGGMTEGYVYIPAFIVKLTQSTQQEEETS